MGDCRPPWNADQRDVLSFAFCGSVSAARACTWPATGMGKKPLYYAQIEWPIPLLVRHQSPIWTYDHAAARYAAIRSPVSMYLVLSARRETIYDNVYQLLPAHYLVLRETGCAEEYAFTGVVLRRQIRGTLDEGWTAPTEVDIPGPCAATASASDGEVPLGAFLQRAASTAVMSSVVWMAAQALNERRVQTFSIGHGGPGTRRTRLCPASSPINGTHNHREFSGHSATTWGDSSPVLVWEFGQPLPSATPPRYHPTYYVAHCARQARHRGALPRRRGRDESFVRLQQLTSAAPGSRHVGRWTPTSASRPRCWNRLRLCWTAGNGETGPASYGPGACATAIPDLLVPAVQFGDQLGTAVHLGPRGRARGITRSPEGRDVHCSNPSARRHEYLRGPACSIGRFIGICIPPALLLQREGGRGDR